MANLMNSAQYNMATMGQLGSIYHEGDDSDADAGIEVDGAVKQQGLVFVAITMLVDTSFSTLTAEKSTLFAGGAIATDIDANGGSAMTGVTIPKGVTIYGRWTSINANTGGKCIAYLG